MKKLLSRLLLANLLCATTLSYAATPTKTLEQDSKQSPAELEGLVARFAPVQLNVDLSKLPENEKKALAKLILAAKALDPIYLRQVWSGNEALKDKLAKDQSPIGKARFAAYMLNKGPWSLQDEGKAFIPGVPSKPEAGSFYPEDSSKEEIEKWFKSLDPKAAADAKGFFTVIRRGQDGKLKAVGYNEEYKEDLTKIAELLKQAAALTQQPTLRTYLEKRAQAFLSNDYYDSDVAWMKLDASIEPTIGPYETYEDQWFSAKAAFEAFIATRDDAETEKLAKFSSELQELENNLPIDAKFRNPKIGALAPIRVVNSVFSSGEADRGVQTAAFNLPNDERIAQSMGTKRVMLKNIQEAKFEKVLVPISTVVLSKADQVRLSFESFFTHILMHELMHGLGPNLVKSKDKTATVREKLQEHYSALEEAKADVSGLWALQRLIDKGTLPKNMESTLYTTFLASSFRSIRFGINEAHGRGVALQINYFLDSGAYKVAKDGTFSVDEVKIKESVRSLTSELMTIQATGDKARADSLFKKLATIRPSVKVALDRLKNIPIDIKPEFTAAESLLKQYPN